MLSSMITIPSFSKQQLILLSSVVVSTRGAQEQRPLKPEQGTKKLLRALLQGNIADMCETIDTDSYYDYPYTLVVDNSERRFTEISRGKHLLKACIYGNGESSRAEAFDREMSTDLVTHIEAINANAQKVFLDLQVQPCCITPHTVFIGANSLKPSEIGKQLRDKFDPHEEEPDMTYSLEECGGETITDFVHNCIEKGLTIPRKVIAEQFFGLIALLKCMAERNLVHRQLCDDNMKIIFGGRRGSSTGSRLINFRSWQLLEPRENNRFNMRGAGRIHLPRINTLQHRTFKKYPRGSRGDFSFEVRTNIFRANDTWYAIHLLYKLITREDLPQRFEYYDEGPGDRKFIIDSVKAKIKTLERPMAPGRQRVKEDETRVKEEQQIIMKVLVPLISLLDDEKADVAKIHEHIIEGDLGAPLREWLNESDREERGFFEKYNRSQSGRRLIERLNDAQNSMRSQ